MDVFMDEEMAHLAMGDSHGSLSNMNNNDLFCTGKVRLQMAMEKSRLTGQPLVKHRNGKIDLGAVLNDPSLREFVCFYCSYSFAYKHVLDRHVSQIHEKHLLCTYQCSKCTYNTVRKDQMRSHFSVIHEDFKPFNCSECKYRAPKAFRVTAHIAKNHGNVGAVIHDTNLRPRPVSPPPPEVIIEAKRQMQIAKMQNCKNAKLLRQQQQSNGSNTTNINIDDGLPTKKPNLSYNLIQVSCFPELAPKTNNKIRILAPAPKQVKPQKIAPAFYCPHCEFKHHVQIIMGDHVILNHFRNYT